MILLPPNSSREGKLDPKAAIRGSNKLAVAVLEIKVDIATAKIETISTIATEGKSEN